MLTLLLRVVNRIRPREGWAVFLLFVTALLSVPAAMLTLDQELGTDALVVLTLLAIILSLGLARSRFGAWTVTILSGLLGAGLVILLVGQLLPPLSLLWNEFLTTVHWVSRWPQHVAGQAPPFAIAAAFAWQRLTHLGVRLWGWSRTVAGGTAAQDPIVLMLLTASLVWALGCFATWQIYRRKSAFLALLPGGVVLATVSFFGSGLSLFYLLVYLCCTLSLTAAWHLRTLQERWRRTGTDYPGDLEMEQAFALALILTITLGLGAVFPVLGPRQVADAFWRVMDGPWSAVQQASERLFGPIELRGGPAGLSGRATLPRAHLLGGGPELGETVVLYVTTSDPAPPPPSEGGQVPRGEGPSVPSRYWRGMTYDTYTGSGWINGSLEKRTTVPNQPLESTVPPGTDLIQQVEVLLPGTDTLYAVNTPVSVDRTVQSWWRAPGDLVRIATAARRYAVLSRPPEPTAAMLRQASSFLPLPIAERYLALPQTVPQEVVDLAHQIAAGRPTRYDQAHAIETYLRAYPYTLDLPDPPADRDVVDYFLFSLQKGYCDYYASAMVVMARAVGIPARLATGYAQGTYDRQMGHWVVTEKDAHTWVEVYFDGTGWVEFEPTAGLPALERPGGEGIPAPDVPPLPPRPVAWWQRVAWPLVGLCLVLITAMGLFSWRRVSARRHDALASDLVRDRYTRLLRWGARLNHPLRDGQTPAEYAARLGQTLRARGQRARLAAVRRSSLEVPAPIRQLADSFARAQYAAEPVEDREGRQIRDLWVRLRRHLRWLWLARR